MIRNRRTLWVMAGAIALTGLLALGATTVSRAHEDHEHEAAEALERAILLEQGHGAYLGVQIREAGHAEGGALIGKVVDDTPAERAGLKAGDVIVAFDGTDVRGPRTLTEEIHQREPGERVTLTVVRDGQRQTVEVELGERRELLRGFTFDEEFGAEWADRYREWAEQWSETYREWQEQYGEEWAQQYEKWQEEHGEELAERAREMAEQYRQWAEEMGERSLAPLVGSRPRLGVQLVETTKELRMHLGGTESSGVLISKVLSGTPAEEAGLEVGDLILAVDGEPVSSSGELVRALADKAGQTVVLRVARNGRQLEIQAQLAEDDEEGLFGPRAMAAPLPPMPDLAPVPPLPALEMPEIVVPEIEIPALAPLIESELSVLAEEREAARIARAEVRERQRELREELRAAHAEARQVRQAALEAERVARLEALESLRDRREVERDKLRQLREEERQRLRELRERKRELRPSTTLI